MLGAILGDIIGSSYEWHNVKAEDFELFPRGSHFTDDSVLTVAVTDSLIWQANNPEETKSETERAKNYAYKIKQYYSHYPDAGFGNMFMKWAVETTLRKQNSYANGGAMRVAPIGFAFNTLEEVLEEAQLSCLYTHNHPEAITGAQAIAATVFLARMGCSKAQIKSLVEKRFQYNLSFTLDNIRPTYIFDSRASYTVPPAIVAFLESDSYENAVRKAISIGGDSDTIACMAGGIAHAFYRKIPKPLLDKGWMLLDSGLKTVIRKFCDQYTITLNKD